MKAGDSSELSSVILVDIDLTILTHTNNFLGIYRQLLKFVGLYLCLGTCFKMYFTRTVLVSFKKKLYKVPNNVVPDITNDLVR